MHATVCWATRDLIEIHYWMATVSVRSGSRDLLINSFTPDTTC
jgi:hypothetical protein